MKLIENSCNNFTAELASKAPVPGGGGAAALTGALSAALCSMAGNLTLGKKKFAEFEEDINRIINKAEQLRARLCALVDMDAEGFEPLSRVYALPKEAPNYSLLMREATLSACKAPLEIMECSCEVIKLAEELTTKSSRLVLSDVGCGAIAAVSALKAAALNVFVNTRTLKGDAEAMKIEARASELLNIFEKRAEAVYAGVLSELRS